MKPKPRLSVSPVGDKASVTLIEKSVLEEAGIPQPFWTHLSAETFPSLNVLKSVNTYIREFDKAAKAGIGLHLHGESSSGRSFLLCHFLMQMMLRGYSIRYVTFAHLISVMLNNEQAVKFESLVLAPDVLGVDDVEQNKGATVAYNRVLQRILKLRHDHGRPVAIVSLLEPSALCREFEGVDVHVKTWLYAVKTRPMGLTVDLEVSKTKETLFGGGHAH